MSTRCNIVLKEQGQPDIWLYHHSDGYPEGVGADLKVLVDNLNRGWRWGYYGDRLQDLADWMCNKGVPSQWAPGIDRAYEHTDGEHGDIEYLYVITRMGDRYVLECNSVRTTFDGDWNRASREQKADPDRWHTEYGMVELPHKEYSDPRSREFFFVPGARHMDYEEASREMEAHDAWQKAEDLRYGEQARAEDGTFIRVRNAKPINRQFRSRNVPSREELRKQRKEIRSTKRKLRKLARSQRKLNRQVSKERRKAL